MHLLTSTTTAMPMTQFTTFTVRNSWEKWWVTGTSIVIEQCKCWYSIFYLLFIWHIFHHERLWGRAGASRSRTFSAWDGAERFDRLQLWLEQIKIVFKISSEFSSNVGIPVFLKIVFQKLEFKARVPSTLIFSRPNSILYCNRWLWSWPAVRPMGGTRTGRRERGEDLDYVPNKRCKLWHLITLYFTFLCLWPVNTPPAGLAVAEEGGGGAAVGPGAAAAAGAEGAAPGAGAGPLYTNLHYECFLQATFLWIALL